MKLLLVEDDSLLGETVQDGLKEADYETTWLAHGTMAWEHLQKATFDGIILDMDLPGMKGKDILRSLREQGNQTPVLVYTGRFDTDPNDYIGADDFLLKNRHFSLKKLIARMGKLLSAD